MISSIPGCLPLNRNSLVDTTLLTLIPPDTAAMMAVAHQDHQPGVHMYSESSKITALNEIYVHSTSSSISMTDTNSNGDGVLSNSSARIPATSSSTLNTELNSDSCYTRLSLNNNK